MVRVCVCVTGPARAGVRAPHGGGGNARRESKRRSLLTSRSPSPLLSPLPAAHPLSPNTQWPLPCVPTLPRCPCAGPPPLARRRLAGECVRKDERGGVVFALCSASPASLSPASPPRTWRTGSCTWSAVPHWGSGAGMAPRGGRESSGWWRGSRSLRFCVPAPSSWRPSAACCAPDRGPGLHALPGWRERGDCAGTGARAGEERGARARGRCSLAREGGRL